MMCVCVCVWFLVGVGGGDGVEAPKGVDFEEVDIGAVVDGAADHGQDDGGEGSWDVDEAFGC